mmetsp:Transcript_18480/g.51760  ORF Transcript_18480/g.51760 Transcript_18480/m.51760 type:complete len:213 (+) Transcript_18480:546-1184(+)|eukprot:CAMPEP_0117675472 /NCGR_PEP_ID=MMETSP0804-20121206/15623_1 /TAXON_ID=1074897 /ORGANISM="Tetraselmis astigmatica, Strain CCMP880" /LENGTH=212 /DNA_ID=CAMNT_0005484477 /DNA_START=49 /DNA_END=687 /DNA_ORIENTATION=-
MAHSKVLLAFAVLLIFSACDARRRLTDTADSFLDRSKFEGLKQETQQLRSNILTNVRANIVTGVIENVRATVAERVAIVKATVNNLQIAGFDKDTFASEFRQQLETTVIADIRSRIESTVANANNAVDVDQLKGDLNIDQYKQLGAQIKANVFDSLADSLNMNSSGSLSAGILAAVKADIEPKISQFRDGSFVAKIRGQISAKLKEVLGIEL